MIKIHLALQMKSYTVLRIHPEEVEGDRMDCRRRRRHPSHLRLVEIDSSKCGWGCPQRDMCEEIGIGATIVLPVSHCRRFRDTIAARRERKCKGHKNNGKETARATDIGELARAPHLLASDAHRPGTGESIQKIDCLSPCAGNPKMPAARVYPTLVSQFRGTSHYRAIRDCVVHSIHQGSSLTNP